MPVLLLMEIDCRRAANYFPARRFLAAQSFSRYQRGSVQSTS